ncbi:MAG: type IV pilus twitching motility protein PilT [Elusimicrobiota bacterium]|nr:type IV pilus twitching motility protein PilT [Endomicrobiia bacterium]MDW8165206.1 type IV pilus twitching motility protein PilT [Elusimicrobiota bacterium]
MDVGLSMENLLFLMHEQKASDLHLTSGLPPMLRIDGNLVPTPYGKLTPEVCQKLIYSVLTDKQKERFETLNELDVSFGVKDLGRIRMNVFRQRGTVAAALRAIPTTPPSFEELRLPKIVYQLVDLPRGLVLVTGPTGSGKTTTLASMINFINEHRNAHIITIEDPIEYLFHHKNCIINQREVGSDTESFATALKYVLREDPDIILIGEMRDLETISAALTIAETGHLVFATLHTTDAVSTVNRIVDVFPPHQQQQVRVQLSFVLQAVLAQQLLLHASGKGRVLACEVLVATPAVRNLIREGKPEQIFTLIQTGAKYGMQTMNQSLADLYQRRLITLDEALNSSSDPEELKKLLQKSGL